MPTVEIIAVGSELLTPERMDTNSLWLTSQLNELGFEVTAKTIVGDQRQRLADAFRQAFASADVVVSTGGLGPTEDDVTRDAAAQALGLNQVHQESLWVELQARFARMGRVAPANNRRQALLLDGAESLPNPNGTAPGQWRGPQSALQKPLVLLPGPPRELKPMFLDYVVPRLRPLAGQNVLLRRTLKVFGLGESALDERLAPLYPHHPDVVVTTLFTALDLEVHLAASGPSQQACREQIGPLEEKMRQELGEYCYGEAQQSLAEVVGQLLLQRKATLVTAESLTGGLVAERITEVAGSSQYFLGGWVCYSEALKQQQLGISAGMLAEFGAVSAPVAEALAAQARTRSGADYALALSGYAGPSGGTADDPVGTVYVGLATPAGVEARRLQFSGDRELVRSRAAQTALDWLRRRLCQP
jgi:nicotinamide-nucleotide amidase